jgi:hypothetical protein
MSNRPVDTVPPPWCFTRRIGPVITPAILPREKVRTALLPQTRWRTAAMLAGRLPTPRRARLVAANRQGA